MKNNINLQIIILLLLGAMSIAITSCSTTADSPSVILPTDSAENTTNTQSSESKPEPPPLTVTPQAENTNSVDAPSLKRGVNFAGDFEVEPRGEWGRAIEADFFDLAAEAGFDHVRVPIRWSAHTGPAPDFVIDEGFFAEVDWLVEQANRVGLSIMINQHFFEALDADPAANWDEMILIWRQIGARYAQQPATVVFELLNEPVGRFAEDPALWNQLAEDVLAAIRETNPTRLVIIGPVQYNHPTWLPTLRLPEDDNLMATVHIYDPTDFTAQGAVWFDPIPPTGVLWSADQPTFDSPWVEAWWDSEVTVTDEGLNVAFERQFAAFGAVWETGTAGTFDTLTVEADQWFEAIVLCDWETTQTIVEFEPSTTAADGGIEMVADISGCGELTQVAVQFIGETLVSPTLRRMDLCPAAVASLYDCARIIVRADESLDRLMYFSAEWAAENNVEMYLGEFGVYDFNESPIDRPSRAEWIRAMRNSAETHNINWAYFELSSEFGVYDHVNKVWHIDMLDALFD